MRSCVTLVAAIVLGACFVRPLSTRTRYVDAKGDAVEMEEGATPPEGATAIVDFLGPLASALHARFGKSARANRVVWWLQPLLLVAAGPGTGPSSP